MKGWNHLPLQTRLEVNQEVAATDHIHARERRVGKDVVMRKNHPFPHRLADPVTTVFLGEKALQPFR